MIVSILCLFLLAACGSKRAVHSGLRQEPPLPATCEAGMQAHTLDYQPAKLGNDAHCKVDQPVRFSRSQILRMSPALTTSCALALAWLDFEPTIEALALRHLDSRVTVVQHYGSYNCRPMSGNRRRMSLHASARAIDIAGFVLADGREISVKRDWNAGAAGRFLHAFANAACERFGVVLTPSHDRDHHDHVHIDIGPWRLCGT
ncbi:MAG: extensin family protein [Geminicoccaceae bacterium]